MKNPIVTIGVCVKDSETTIKPVINSILSQDYPHDSIEAIFVNDGSKDKTLSILIDCLSNVNIIVKIHHWEWRGLGPSRNYIVNNATGKYIIWVDDDFILSNNYVRILVNTMEQNPRFGLVKTVCKICEKEKMGLAIFLERLSTRARFDKHKDETPDGCGTGGAIFRTIAVRQVGGFDEGIKGAGEDIEVSARIKKAGWLLGFCDLEYSNLKLEGTWKDLWDKYFWYGYGSHYVNHIHKNNVPFWTNFPPVAFISGLVIHSFRAYKRDHLKISFLLPFQFSFKKLAWCIGYIKSHFNDYGHLNQKTTN